MSVRKSALCIIGIMALLALAGCATGTVQAPPNGNGSPAATIPAPSTPPPAEIVWLLGTWEGEQVGNNPYSVMYPSTVKVWFRVVGSGIRWDLSNNSVYSWGRAYSEATGSAEVSGMTLTLKGRYVSGYGAGTELTYELTRNGNSLEGIGHGYSPMFRASWTKVK